uniref:NADH-ubiquinone oxidoreductase chain 1 n=1 Tax=Brachiopoda sp. TaxID=3230945 RepID=A0AAU8HN56_9BILA
MYWMSRTESLKMIPSLAAAICTVIPVLLSMAFYTLLERKVLSYSQIRKGPNKAGITGIPQAMSDALKLFSKQTILPNLSSSLVFTAAPSLALILALIPWLLYSSQYSQFHAPAGILVFLCISSLTVYSSMMAGWASNSKYALLGAIRSIAQTISYEVSMILIILIPLTLNLSFDLKEMGSPQNFQWTSLILPPLLMAWLVTCLAETSRAPFDFSEGESELVSGFNIEYGASSFALLFMAEYTNILFLSLLTSAVLLGSNSPLTEELGIFLWMKTGIISLTFLWARATLPRFRYDLLMGLTWKSFLPVFLSILLPTIALVTLTAR